jgi:hypothetical protein
MSSKRPETGIHESRIGRLAPLARLALRIGGRYLARSPQLVFASVERRTELRHDLLYARLRRWPKSSAT